MENETFQRNVTAEAAAVFAQLPADVQCAIIAVLEDLVASTEACSVVPHLVD